MGTTTNGLPYPEPTDLVTNGATAIEALAEAVEARLLGNVLQAAESLTAETVDSFTYAPETGGPSATVTVGPSGRVLTLLFVRAYHASADEVLHAAVEATGANTVPATDDYSVSIRSPLASALSGGVAVRLFDNLDTGATTFAAAYRVNTGAGVVSSRTLVAIPL